MVDLLCPFKSDLKHILRVSKSRINYGMFKLNSCIFSF